MKKKHHLTNEQKTAAVKKLNRIAGQINGLSKMIDEDRYCVDILMQVSSIHEALRGFGKTIMKSHLQTCVTSALSSKDERDKEDTYKELMDVIYKYAK